MIINLEIFLPILIGVALLTLAERKVLGSIQRRKGPNIVGIYGILQPIVDGLKLVLKESISPIKSNYLYYLIAPLYTFLLSLLIWTVIPFNIHFLLFDTDFSILFIFAISSIGIYGILYGGWASNSKYAFIGALRATSQLISYEVSIGIILINIITLNSSINLLDIVYSQIYLPNIFYLFIIYILLIISVLAETNRTPFDLLEAESELVAGFLVEYSSLVFAAFYLGEYCIILFMSTLLSLLFFGTTGISIFTLIILFKIIWIRASFPRLRYDQLMNLGWTFILPLSMLSFLFFYSFSFLFDLS